MGHSRGGDGVRSAVNQYRAAGSPWPSRIGPVTFRSIFEIGPPDFQKVAIPTNVTWNAIVPGCDGDAFLNGLGPFDRALRSTADTGNYAKSVIRVYGANHNFYNTQWQENENDTSCLGQAPLFPAYVGSPKQRATALETLVPFFRSNLAKAPVPALARLFDPSYPLPPSMTSLTLYDRMFSASPRASENFVIDNFDKPTGTSTRNVPNEAQNLRTYAHVSSPGWQDSLQRAASVRWSGAGGSLTVSAAGYAQGVDVGPYKSLEFRVMASCLEASQCQTTQPTPAGDIDFSIRLTDASGQQTFPVSLKSRAAVRFESGATVTPATVLQTVRIPLTAFTGFDPAGFQGVRFDFDQSEKGSVYIANVRLTKAEAADTVLP
jgi:hypothetical protein